MGGSSHGKNFEIDPKLGQPPGFITGYPGIKMHQWRKRGLGPQAIKQSLAHQYDSCEECEYFYGLNEYWQVGCEYDVSQLTPGLRKLVEISRNKGRGERNTELDCHTPKRWGRLVRND